MLSSFSLCFDFERESERDMDGLPPMCAPTKDQPETWTCVLTKNWTHDPLVHETTLEPTEPCWPGQCYYFYCPHYQPDLTRVIVLCPQSLWQR